MPKSMFKTTIDKCAMLLLAGVLAPTLACGDSTDPDPETGTLRCHDDDVELELGADGTWGIMLEDVALRPGVTVDLFVNVYGDIDGECQLAVHGGTFAAASWRPYAEALGPDTCVLAPDMPVRGNSGVPSGAQFGDLDLFDYVTAIEQVLTRLNALDVEPKTIVGHSLGGTVVQMLQQRLVDQGTSLEHRFDIDEAILVASDLPAEVPWALGDSGDLGGLLAAFAVDDPVHGLLFEIPVELWPAFFFTDRQGNIAPGSPSVADIVAAGYNALGEPLKAIQQLNGTAPYNTRPHADAELFEDDTRLRVIAFEEDIYVQLGESETLYQHLTGDEDSNCYVPIYGPDTVHTMQFSNPAKLVAAIEAAEDCRYQRRGRRHHHHHGH